ncbi:MAG: TonB-dependent receptor [Alteromonadales bacterium]|nr:TonB-dependent receptor [Alteromonadales bacterium]
MYNFYDGALEGFSDSAGARYVGASYADLSNTLEVPSYTVFDLGLSYMASNGLDFALNASNVTDKQYYASCNTLTCSQGVQRKITGSVTYRW